MADENNTEATPPGVPAKDSPLPPSPDISSDEAVPPNQLSKEEQMARFEEDLKYNDWGHQPC